MAAELGPVQLQLVIFTFQIIKTGFYLIPSIDILQSDLIGRSCLQGCREKFSVGGEDGRETEISADKYSIYAAPKAPPKFSGH